MLKAFRICEALLGGYQVVHNLLMWVECNRLMAKYEIQADTDVFLSPPSRMVRLSDGKDN